MLVTIATEIATKHEASNPHLPHFESEHSIRNSFPARPSMYNINYSQPLSQKTNAQLVQLITISSLPSVLTASSPCLTARPSR